MSESLESLRGSFNRSLRVKGKAELRDRCTAFVAELGVRRQVCAAQPAGHSRRRQRTATAPSVIHVSIVSPLFNGVRHIAVPPPTRSLGRSYVVCFGTGIDAL